MSNDLMVGAGKAVIKYTENMFPTFDEHYTGVHDDSYAQVIILKKREVYAIVAVGTVIIYEKKIMADKVAEIVGTSADHVIIHAKHVLSAPHALRDQSKEKIVQKMARSGQEATDEQLNTFIERDNMICDALICSACQATQKALESVRKAKIRFGCGYTDIITNRLVKTDLGWWQGHNPDLPADRTLPVIRFEGMDGHPIAVLFNCNVAPGCLENSFMSDGGRLASGDLAAVAENKIDEMYGPDCVSVYLTGCTGDHWQSLRAVHDEIDINGKQTVTDLHEAGFLFAEILGDRLSEAVVKACEASQAVPDTDDIFLKHYVFTYTGQKTEGAAFGKPTQKIDYLQNGDKELGFDIMIIGEIALLFVGVELGSRTWNEIKSKSPFKYNILVEFANENGGGYLPEKDFYDKITYQSTKSRYFAGTAEQFTADVIRMMKQI